MKCTKRMRTRCECDYCGKKNWSVGHMRKHEKHCTKNPERECRVCKMVEGEQKAIAALMAVLPEPTTLHIEGEYDSKTYIDGAEKRLNESLPALRDLCDNCPACILAALRQKGILVPMATDFDFTNEMKSIWAEINQHQLEGNGGCY